MGGPQRSGLGRSSTVGDVAGEDAVEIDTSDMTLDEVKEAALQIVAEKTGE